MADRTVKIDITADEKGFTSGTGKASASATSLEKALTKLGPVGKGIQSVLDKLGLSSVSSALGIASIPAALGAGVAIVNHSIDQYVALAAKVRDYSIVTGQSAEVSSQQVQAFEELGVSEETAASSMVKLSKAIETTPKKLADLGIEIAKDSKGNVDLGQTLLNVMDAFQGTADAAKRNEIAITAFGKGGTAMIPILETNTAELKQLESAINLVYTDKQLEQARQYSIQQKQLGQNWSDFMASMGEGLVGALADTFKATNQQIEVQKILTQEYHDGKISADEYTAATGAGLDLSNKLVQATLKQVQAADAAKDKVDELAAAQKKAADAAQAEADAEDALYTSLNKVSDASDALTDANFALRDSQNRVRDAVAAYDKAVKENGKTSQAARDALLAVQEARQAEIEQYRKVAEATVAQAEAQAEANDTTLTAGQKADIYRQKLIDLMNTLGPNDPLRKNLQAYISELNAIPSDKTTTISTKFRGVSAPTSGRTGGTQSFADGGMVTGSSDEHPVMARAGEMVLTPEQQRALPGMYSGRDSGVTEIHVHVDRGAFIDGPGIDRLANEILRRVRYASGR